MLWRAIDGTTFESVLMRYPQRNTVCISSQAGCGMACPFCATGQGGLTRNLSPAEILEQVRAAAVELRDRDHGRLSNVVFMGMGEPLANYNRTLAAVRRITAAPPRGFGISARAVTVSTVGLAPAVRKLADERLGVTLALSLHAPDDELRDTLVPVNNRWKIAEALDAARYYADATGRRVSIEYALIRDVNDQPWRADLLGKRLHGALGPLVHVNVIPLNPTPGSEWDASPKPAEREFVKRVPRRVRARCATLAGVKSLLPVDNWPPKVKMPVCRDSAALGRTTGVPAYSSPVSSCGLLVLLQQGLQGSVVGGVVGGVGLPAVPDDVEPCAGEDAHGVGVVVSAGAGAVVVVGGPGVGVAGVVGEVADGVAELFIAGPAKPDDVHLAGLSCGGRHAGQTHQCLRGGESGTAVPDF